LKNHKATKLHKRKEEKIKIVKLLDSSKNKVINVDLKNIEGEIIASTRLNVEVYKHILVNHHIISFSDNHVNIIHDGITDPLHRYIYYDFYKKKQIAGHPVIDHRNRKPLDNRLCNLRPATRIMNSRNKSKCKNSTSNYFGVSYYRKQWHCCFLFDGKNNVFNYENETHAAYHYDLLVKEHKMVYCAPINNIAKPIDFVRKIRKSKIENLPKGIGRSYRKYYFRFHKKSYHGFTTVKAAVDARNIMIKAYQEEKQKKILSSPIKRNTEGIAIIELFDAKKKKVGEVFVDDNKYYQCVIYKWNYTNRQYAHGKVNGKNVKLHRFIMNCYDPNVKIDHDNRNKLDCRVKNLIRTTDLLNSQNKSKKKGNSTSKYIGVSFEKIRNQYIAYIKPPNAKRIWVGSFDTELEAAKARDKKAKELNALGNHFSLNFEK